VLDCTPSKQLGRRLFDSGALFLSEFSTRGPKVKRKPRPFDRGGKRKSLGVSGVRGDPSACKLGRWRLRCGLILIQAPRIAALFQLVDNVIGDGVSLILAQSLFQPPDNLARSPQGVGDGVSKDLAAGHLDNRTYQEQDGKPLGLVAT
jgi:hypothetical protein